jgi:hypothetical protein
MHGGCRVRLVGAHPSPTKYFARVDLPFFRQRILGPHLANYFARICEWEGWASIGSQNFGYKPNNGKNLMGSQFFGGATMGTKPNTPVDYSDNLVPVPYTGVVSYITSKFLTSIFCTCLILIIYKV